MRPIGAGRWGKPFEGGPFVGERYAGSLRWLYAGGVECVRMVGLVVRDRAWRTLLPDALEERVTSAGWVARGRTPVGPASLDWRLVIAPRPAGLHVHATMTAAGDVVTNRSGIVVLLPAATFAGAGFAARHTGDGCTRGRLPRRIAPHQPVRDLRGLRVAGRDGLVLDLAFEGETFEMEDQRNWLDASFKLYSRALSRPFPYRIRAGATVEQRVHVDLVRAARRAPRRARTLGRGIVPQIGIATVPERVPTDPAVVAALRDVSPAIVLHRTDRRGRGMNGAARLAQDLGAVLRVEAFGDGPSLADAIRRDAPQAVAPYFSGPNIRGALAARRMQIVGGTFADFVMLNRNGVNSEAERAAFALCPTVHARDDRSLIESLDTLPALLAQARRLAAGRPLDIGPCTLFRRLVPQTGKPATRGPDGSPGYDLDPRQHQPIAAAWLACVIAVASVRRVDSLCTFEAEGPRGLVLSGRRSPAHAVLAAFGRRGRSRVTLLDLNALQGAAFVIESEPAELWLVDLSGRPRKVHLGRRRTAQPYSIVRVDVSRARLRALATVARAWCRGDGS